MLNTPLIVPVKSSDSSSYTQRCLERPELSDLYKKALNQRQFTDEDTERLTKCIGERKEESEKMLAGLLIVVAFIIIAAIIIVIIT